MDIFWYKDFAILSSSINGSIELIHKAAVIFILLHRGIAHKDLSSWVKEKWGDSELNMEKLFPILKPFIMKEEPIREFYRDRLLYSPTGLRLFPSHVSIKITDKCDLKCSYCFFRKKLSRKSLGTSKVISLLDEISELDGVHLHIAGGEPFLHQDIFDILQHAFRLNIFMTISTNAIGLAEEKIQKAIRSGLNRVQVSLDTLDFNEFYKITGSRKVEQLKSNLSSLVKNSVKVTVRTVVSDENVESLIDIAKYTKSIGIESHYFTEVLPIFPFDKTDLVEVKRTCAKESIMKVVGDFTHCHFDEYIQPTSCTEFNRSLVIESDGSYSFCHFLTDETYGNARDSKLLDVWASDNHRRVIKLFSAREKAGCHAILNNVIEE